MNLDAKISMARIWADEDMVELDVQISNGASYFSNRVYVGLHELRDIVTKLDRFKDQVHGGVHDLRLGEFGPESGSGAVHLRMNFQARGRIYITACAQAEFERFGDQKVASEATLYLVSQPAQLDDFVRGLRALSEEQRDDAVFFALPADSALAH